MLRTKAARKSDPNELSSKQTNKLFYRHNQNIAPWIFTPFFLCHFRPPGGCRSVFQPESHILCFWYDDIISVPGLCLFFRLFSQGGLGRVQSNIACIYPCLIPAGRLRLVKLFRSRKNGTQTGQLTKKLQSPVASEFKLHSS